MATHVITVYATHAKPKPLTIRDDEGHFADTAEDDAKLTTLVKVGDTVKWVVSGDITEIISIEDKSLPNNLFTGGFTKNADGSMQAVVAPNAASVVLEKYNIHYRLNGLEYIEDPKIKVDPNG